MASKVAKSSTRKNLIKNFYKPAKGSKMNAMAFKDSISGFEMPAVDANFASGYPNDISKEWYSRVDEYYDSQDKGNFIESSNSTSTNVCQQLPLMRPLQSPSLAAYPRQRTLATPTKRSTVHLSTSHCLLFPTHTSSISSQMQRRSPVISKSKLSIPSSPRKPIPVTSLDQLLMTTHISILSREIPMASLSQVVLRAHTTTASTT